MPELDLQNIRNIHFVGVGGCGMSGLARIMHDMGYNVTGSDVKEGPNTLRLKDLGIRVLIGHKEANSRNSDLVVYSSAVVQSNVELVIARQHNIPVIQRAELLSWVLDRSQTRIAIAGTHGKTTTTAMTAKVLEAGRLNPTFMIGCDMDYADGNARFGDGRYAVTEADESDSSFLKLNPTIEIVTNIEADHMEHFASFQTLVETFEKFTAKLPENGLLLIDGTDKNNQSLAKKVNCRVIRYGLSGDVEFTAKNLSYRYSISRYTLVRGGQELGEVVLSVPGWQNVLNSLPVFALGFEFGLDFGFIAGALRSFAGARRRFQIVGKFKDILIVDDYAHHPTEIKATLAAARGGWKGKRIICVFQPHRYTRTAILREQFSEAFKDADKVIITDIYAASEEPIPGISGQTIVDGIKDKDVEYIPRKEKIADYLMANMQEGDLILTVGAGDIYTVGRELFARLKMQ